MSTREKAYYWMSEFAIRRYIRRQEQKPGVDNDLVLSLAYLAANNGLNAQQTEDLFYGDEHAQTVVGQHFSDDPHMSCD